ncbi:MAG: M18 family aminopeptidase [Ilumatobacteraceae bacterium]
MTSTHHNFTIEDCIDLLDAAPSPFHAVAEFAQRLLAAGATELSLGDEWNSASVDGFRFIRRDGALIAWKTPTTSQAAPDMLLVGAHTDSPCFKLKPNPDIYQYGWNQLSVEVYGGILNNSWLDRDLGLAGRVVSASGETALIQTDAIARIPQLAIHLDRGVNDGLRLDPQTHLTPIWGLNDPSRSVVGHLKDISGLDSVAWWDVSLFDTQPAARLGANGELLASGRLDNLVSCWAAVTALCATEPGAQLQVIVLNDHEEVGSSSATGAGGPTLEQVLTRIVAARGGTTADLARALSRSMCISADNAHALHPNYPERHDHGHAPVVNKGPAIKVNVNQRYATSSVSAQRYAAICEEAGLQTQVFSSRNNMPCGSTIGPITATRLGIDTIDVGVPQLSMHSARELCGVDDPITLAQSFVACWS